VFSFGACFLRVESRASSLLDIAKPKP
jgi:hypothetical protein